ncbi:MAG: hypothetical protein ACREVX_04600 [Clostridium sp.]|uniref:hypothetical protein n=1 Tax=Clostridium sp. TaxID=1506 RepID=UPI003D6D3399
MSKNKIKKSILIGSLITLLGGLVVFSYSILYNSGVVLRQTASIEVMNKLKDIHGQGGKFELTQKDIDELSNLLMPKTKGDVAFKGVNIDIVGDELLIEAPVTYNSYKKVNLLLSSKGKLGTSNGEITYDPENFKIGKLKLPKKIVMSQVVKLNNENVYAEDNLIKIDPNISPIKINNFKVEDDKIQGSASIVSSKKSPKNMNNEKKVIDNSINGNDKVVNKPTNSNKGREIAKSAQTTEKQTETKQVSLKKAKKDLSDAYNQVKTPKEQKVISKMQSTVSKMEKNSSYDAKKDQAAVKSSYDTLDADSQDRVKIALFTNVDQKNLGQLRQDFGL